MKSFFNALMFAIHSEALIDVIFPILSNVNFFNVCWKEDIWITAKVRTFSNLLNSDSQTEMTSECPKRGGAKMSLWNISF